MNDYGFSKVTGWHDIGDGIKWRYYRHWGQNYPAGEGSKGITDKNGVVVDVGTDNEYCNKPIVFVARKYLRNGSKFEVSAVLSYPNGLGFNPDYFWEIYPDETGDCSRFDSEEEMEREIKRFFNTKKCFEGDLDEVCDNNRGNTEELGSEQS